MNKIDQAILMVEERQAGARKAYDKKSPEPLPDCDSYAYQVIAAEVTGEILDILRLLRDS